MGGFLCHFTTFEVFIGRAGGKNRVLEASQTPVFVFLIVLQRGYGGSNVVCLLRRAY